MATQRFLRAHGYNVAADGQWGPVTAAAAEDFRSNHMKANAKAFAAHFNLRYAVPTAGQKAVANRGVQPHGNPADNGDAAQDPQQQNTAPDLGLTRAALAETILNKLAMPKPINVNQYATAAADQQYAPGIDWLKGLLTQQQGSLAPALGQIDSEYTRASTRAQDNAKDVANTGAALLGQQATSNQNVLAALGVDAGKTPGLAGALAGSAQRSQAALAADVNTANDAASRRASDMGHDQALADTAYQNYNARRVADLQDQLTGQTEARGAAVVKARTDADNMNQQRLAQYIANRGNLFTQLGIEKTLPGQLVQQGQAIEKTATDLKNQQQQYDDAHVARLAAETSQRFRDKLASRQYQDELSAKNLPDTWANFAKDKTRVIGLQQTALGKVYNSQTNTWRPNLKPDRAWDIVKGTFTSLGYSMNNPAVLRAAQQVMRDTNYQDKGYHWNDKLQAIVKNGSDSPRNTHSNSKASPTSVHGTGKQIVAGRAVVRRP